MPFALDHLLFVVLAVLFPLRAATFGFRRLRMAAVEERPRVRRSVYRQALVLQWTLVVIVSLLWIFTGRAWDAIGLVPQFTPVFFAMAAVIAVAAAILVRNRRDALASAEALADVRRRMEHVELMLPHTQAEARWFYALSFTAGICEEILYRGYLIWYLAHWAGVLPAAAIASVIFGIGHSYQGARGVLTTALLGAIFCAVYLITGSLLAPMVVHVLIDLHAGHLAFRAYVQERREADDRLRAHMEEAAAVDRTPGLVASFEGGAGGVKPGSADVIVVGLGAMGSAAVDELSRRGLRVAGFDRFHPPHAQGSSHGETRLIREAYFEDPRYVPLVQRAYELWGTLERGASRPLMQLTGGLLAGPPDGPLVSGALRSAEAHDLPHERLDAAAIRRRFPGFEPSDEMTGVWEPRMGMLFPEACIEALLARAASNGAALHFDEPVLSWRADGDGVEVETPVGRHTAVKLLICSGRWVGTSLSSLNLPVNVARQPLFWYQPANAERFDPSRSPAWIWEYEREKFIYGFPTVGGLVKAAVHGQGENIDPGDPREDVVPGEADMLTSVLQRHMPDVPARLVRGVVCRYTNLPDGHFLVDAHPEHSQVLVVSACSGHGFKFAPALGEVFADLLQEKLPPFDISLFALSRFGHGVPGTGTPV